MSFKQSHGWSAPHRLVSLSLIAMLKPVFLNTVFALLFAVAVAVVRLSSDVLANDFAWALWLARDVVANRDPYAFTPTPEYIPYPLPTAFLGLPLLSLSDKATTSLFVGLLVGLWAWVALQRSPWRILALLSAPVYWIFNCGQWTLFIAAVWYFPTLLPLMVLIKPHIALPLYLSRPSRRGIVLAAGTFIASLLVYPLWPLRWLQMLGPYQSIYPLQQSFGWLLLLALLRPAKPQARMLALTALMPFRGIYDLMPLALIPRTPAQMILFVLASWLFLPLVVTTPSAVMALHGLCLIMVLI